MITMVAQSICNTCTIKARDNWVLMYNEFLYVFKDEIISWVKILGLASFFRQFLKVTVL